MQEHEGPFPGEKIKKGAMMYNKEISRTHKTLLKSNVMGFNFFKARKDLTC